MVCGERFHGRCEKREKCINCKGEHRANDRKCEVYRKQEEVNRTMAKEGVSGYVTRKKENEARKNGKESTNGIEKGGMKEAYIEEKGIGEARGGSWADIVASKSQKQEEMRENEGKRNERK